jgi:oligoribonuclease
MIWCDLETFGLEDNSPILEYAFIITDLELHVIDDHTDMIWTSPEYDELYQDMANPGVQGGAKAYVYNMHKKSGLWEEARSYGAHPFQAETEINDWLQAHGVVGDEPLCGNSVHQDRVWLRHTWPSVDARFHYRIVDVSTLKELCNRFDPDAAASKPEKGLEHRALGDLHETIAEFKHYFKSGFIRDALHRSFE